MCSGAGVDDIMEGSTNAKAGRDAMGGVGGGSGANTGARASFGGDGKQVLRQRFRSEHRETNRLGF